MSMTDEDFQKLDGFLTRRIGEAVMQGIGVFAEDVQHKFELLAEGQQMLSERMDRMETNLHTEIREVANRVTHVEVKLIGVETRLDRIDHRLVGV